MTEALLGTVLALVLSLIALSRVAAALFPTVGQALEIGLGMAILAVGAWIVSWRTAGLAAFALLQTMHYVVWLGFFPLFGREETREFGRAMPALRGWRLPALAVVAGALLLVAFFASYAAGRTI